MGKSTNDQTSKLTTALGFAALFVGAVASIAVALAICLL